MVVVVAGRMGGVGTVAVAVPGQVGILKYQADQSHFINRNILHHGIQCFIQLKYFNLSNYKKQNWPDLSVVSVSPGCSVSIRFSIKTVLTQQGLTTLYQL